MSGFYQASLDVLELFGVLDEVASSLRLGQGVEFLPELHGFLQVVAETLHDRSLFLGSAPGAVDRVGPEVSG